MKAPKEIEEKGRAYVDKVAPLMQDTRRLSLAMR